jgi:hypothetical protein
MDTERIFTVVEWVDPADHDDGWLHDDDAKKLSAPGIVSTYGEILDEDETFLKIAYNRMEKDKETHKSGIIIKSTIVRRRDYKYPWRKPYVYKPKEPARERDNTAS